MKVKWIDTFGYKAHIFSDEMLGLMPITDAEGLAPHFATVPECKSALA